MSTEEGTMAGTPATEPLCTWEGRFLDMPGRYICSLPLDSFAHQHSATCPPEHDPAWECHVFQAPAGAIAAPGPCIFAGCVSADQHWHGGFPGGYTNPADPDGPPIAFTVQPSPVFFFPGDQLGRVVSNSGRYLGIHVQFDEPMHFTDGTVKTSHGFLPVDLMLVCSRCGAAAHACPTPVQP